MNTLEFEGRTEREAVARAAAELGSESFDVEILKKAGGLFGRSKVRIRVKLLDSIPDPLAEGNTSKKEIISKEKPKGTESNQERSPAPVKEPSEPVEPPSEELQKKAIEFVQKTIELMGFAGTVEYSKMEETKAVFEITSEFSNILIGRRGQNLDAIQLLTNSFLNSIAEKEMPMRVVLDIEEYRSRREDYLIRKAHSTADDAVRTQSSRLMEIMNPFERRLVHTAISEREDVVTRSEGEGLYKRVRISAKNAPMRSRKRR